MQIKKIVYLILILPMIYGFYFKEEKKDSYSGVAAVFDIMDGEFIGSAFFVKNKLGKTVLLTNAHVCNALMKFGGVYKTYDGVVGTAKTKRVYEASDLCEMTYTRSPHRSLVVGKIEGNIATNVAYVDGRIKETRSTFTQEKDIKMRCVQGSYKHCVEGQDVVFEKTYRYFENTEHGQSGSPMIQGEDKVVGIMFAKSNGLSEDGHFIGSDKIAKFLDL